MQEKHADNKIDDAKKKIDALDEQIISNRKTLNSLDELEASFASINRSLNKCIELINKSMKGKRVNNMMNDMSQENVVRFSKAVYSLDDERTKIKKEIDNCYNEKDKTMEFLKKELEKEEHLNKEEKEKQKEKEKEATKQE